VSEKQRIANRRNAKKSTGPKTSRGKKTSSRNATTHGLTAKSWLNEEESSLYNNLLEAFHEEYNPKTTTETLLVERLASIATRI